MIPVPGTFTFKLPLLPLGLRLSEILNEVIGKTRVVYVNTRFPSAESQFLVPGWSPQKTRKKYRAEGNSRVTVKASVSTDVTGNTVCLR